MAPGLTYENPLTVSGVGLLPPPIINLSPRRRERTSGPQLRQKGSALRDSHTGQVGTTNRLQVSPTRWTGSSVSIPTNVGLRCGDDTTGSGSFHSREPKVNHGTLSICHGKVRPDSCALRFYRLRDSWGPCSYVPGVPPVVPRLGSLHLPSPFPPSGGPLSHPSRGSPGTTQPSLPRPGLVLRTQTSLTGGH